MKLFLALIFVFFVSFSPAFAIDLGFSSQVTTLATADVRQTVTAAVIKFPELVIQNPASNTVSIFLGGSDVTTSGATQGIEIVPGGSIALTAEGRNNILLSSKFFIISTGTAIPVIIGRVTLN